MTDTPTDRTVSLVTRPPEPIPYNLDAEESLLGACLLSREAIKAAVGARVEPSDFYKPSHGLIYTAILDAHAAGEHADPVVIAARLNGQGALVGGPGGARAELARIQGATPASAHAAAYARIIRDAAHRRSVMELAASVRETARDGGDIATLVAHLTVATATADQRLRTVEGGTFTLDVPDTIPAVWGHEDRVLWAEGEGLLIVGPPGVGKTTIAVQLVAARLGIIDVLLDLPVSPEIGRAHV